MRELSIAEMNFVSGAGDDCPSDGGGNTFGGVSDMDGIGDDLVAIYEGVVAAVSHVIERVANAF